MASTLSARIRSVPWLLKDGVRQLLARATGQERDRRLAARDHVFAHAARGDSDSVLRALDDFGRNKRFLMNVGDEKGPILEEEVRKAGPDARVVEFGCFLGYSAILIARNLGPQGKLVSVEASRTSVAVASEIIGYAGLIDKVDFVQGTSDEMIPKLAGPFDLVFFDHWKPAYKDDLQAMEAHGHLREGTVVVADNVGPFFGSTEYLEYVRGCGHYESRYIESRIEYQDIEDGVEISIYRGARPA